ncbi:hypothetical protein [Pedobacter sp. FW305-3-2-15-E-R2A2]|jgi:hypothetical protein|uniref:hypothetical protein n=1 Tax=Pedobacter sp. FW305-3-2-15-E-R2A2 TaxID=3140251 RepID=UPI0031402567
MKRKKITITLNELPKGAKYIPQDIVSAFQNRLSKAMEKVNSDFIKSQRVTSQNNCYISVDQNS